MSFLYGAAILFDPSGRAEYGFWQPEHVTWELTLGQALARVCPPHILGTKLVLARSTRLRPSFSPHVALMHSEMKFSYGMRARDDDPEGTVEIRGTFAELWPVFEFSAGILGSLT